MPREIRLTPSDQTQPQVHHSPSRQVAIEQQPQPIVHKPTKRPLKAPAHLKSDLPGPKVNRTHNVNAAAWIESGQWVQVKSSNVKGISYKAQYKRLLVEFKGGKGQRPVVYSYDGVSPETAAAMFNSSSMGKFVHTHLKGRYPYHKV